MGQKGSKIKITETDRAVLELKRSKDEIHKFTKRTDQLISSERSELKNLMKENPRNYKENTKVRFLLKRIHYQEHLLERASDQLINLENMVSTVEFKLIEAHFLKGIQNGNELLKKLNREFKNLDEILDDVQEQIAYQNEIDETLSHSLAGVNDYEEEIDRELDRLNKEVNPEQTIKLPSTEGLASLPEPVHKEDLKDGMPSQKVEKVPGTEAVLLS
ncbi:hypothetical protein KAFR_0D03290 [Kazachstania africana CBS 2517]|uniref:Vacuolar protein sorting-associated protein 20 n=1 Tax=Kazachstania africana (strain ATCC 22294 / BCRC 22015 / CBS 2517 / CECT 1963 / NBRC 1671 / NRRL Y-8276) TaxID=1071382 RepID=H2AUC7_KAZAF|nr:hypothetical protein KAFR_0D03290 [Kazachstania africana CBS 2517]CCF57977.1 hypothetical protein KAFR_0D03290 [Kazachstania africana CBS 2517]